jgi:hypothetical protein
VASFDFEYDVPRGGYSGPITPSKSFMMELFPSKRYLLKFIPSVVTMPKCLVNPIFKPGRRKSK